MELAMFRHSSMPGISSCSTFRSLQRSVMVPEEPETLREAGRGGQGWHKDSAEVPSPPAAVPDLRLSSATAAGLGHGGWVAEAREPKKPNLVSRREPPLRGGWYQPKFCTLRTRGGQCPLLPRVGREEEEGEGWAGTGVAVGCPPAERGGGDPPAQRGVTGLGGKLRQG